MNDDFFPFSLCLVFYTSCASTDRFDLLIESYASLPIDFEHYSGRYVSLIIIAELLFRSLPHSSQPWFDNGRICFLPIERQKNKKEREQEEEEEKEERNALILLLPSTACWRSADTSSFTVLFLCCRFFFLSLVLLRHQPQKKIAEGESRVSCSSFLLQNAIFSVFLSLSLCASLSFSSARSYC